MNYTKLTAEISADPLGRYDGKTDAEVTASLNTADRTVADSTRRSFRDLLRWEGIATAGTIYGKLKTAAESNNGIALAVAAASDYGDSGGLDFSHAQTIAGINGMVSSVLTSDEATKLKALGEKTISRAVELGLGTVKEGHVRKARAS